MVDLVTGLSPGLVYTKSNRSLPEARLRIRLLGEDIVRQGDVRVSLDERQFAADGGHSDRGVDRLDLLVLSASLSEARDDSLDTESLQVRLIAEVAAIGDEADAIRLLEDTLVGPLPDEAAEHTGGAINLAPVLLHIAEGVAHSVGVLARQDRAGIRVISGDREETFPTSILWALHIIVGNTRVEVLVLSTGVEATNHIDIGRVRGLRDRAVEERAGALSTLVVDKARRVSLANPRGGGGEVTPPPCLVAETPADDAGVVAVAKDEALSTVEPSGSPRRVTSETTAETMLLDVRLVEDEETETVAEFVPAFHIRIVASPDSVDISTFHQKDVPNHERVRHDMTRDRVHLVAIDSTETSRNTIDKKLTAGNLDRADANIVADLLDNVAETIGEGESERVEVRVLGRPELRIVDRRLEPAPHRIATLRSPEIHNSRLVIDVEHSLGVGREEVAGSDVATIGIGEGEGETVAVAREAVERLELRVDRDESRRARDRSTDSEVADADRVSRKERDATVEAGDAPHILILEVATIGVLQDLESNKIVSVRAEERRQTELGGLHATLRVAHERAVDIEIESRRDRAEADEDLAPLPVGRETERAAVAARRVTLDESRVVLLRLAHDTRRVDLESIARATIDRSPVAKHLPVAGDGDEVPARVREASAEEVGGLLVWGTGPMKTPETIER